MNNKKINATVAEEATNETINAAEDAASINKKQEEMKKKKKVVPTTKLAQINGEYVEIIPAYTEYSMELPEYNDKLCEKLDCGKLLPVIFNLAKPEVFRKEGVQLYDRTGKVIDEGTPNVYVVCSTADSWRVWIDKKLERIELHEYSSVQEYAQAVGATNLYSRGLNNTEKIGIAALATGNEAYRAVFEFAKEHELSSTTASLYLDVKMTKLQTMKMSTGIIPKTEPELGRSVEEAEKLLSQATKTFGENAYKRYAIRAINVLDHQDEYNFDMIIEAMQKITETEVDVIGITPSDARESTISSMLTKHMEKQPLKGVA